MEKKLPSNSTSRALNRISIFGPPPILEDEDSAAYDELLARVSGDVKPTGVIEEIWVHDVVDLTWEILRLRRVKTNLLASAMPAALERTLAPLIPRRRPSKSEKVTDFPSLNLNFTPGPPSPQEKLTKKWAARNPSAVNRVSKLLASANITMETVIANAFVDKFDQIERIDRFIMIVEGRRNAAFREIDRHRTTLAHSLRQTIRDVEGEFKVVEPESIIAKKTTIKMQHDQRAQD
jgi:hypothetical protein